MNNTVDITFLTSVRELTEEGFYHLESLDLNEQPAKVILWRLNAMKKTYDKILREATIDELGNLYTDKSQVPEILWLRNSSAMIGKDIHKHPEAKLDTLLKDMNHCHQLFESFYEAYA